MRCPYCNKEMICGSVQSQREIFFTTKPDKNLLIPSTEDAEAALEEAEPPHPDKSTAPARATAARERQCSTCFFICMFSFFSVVSFCCTTIMYLIVTERFSFYNPAGGFVAIQKRAQGMRKMNTAQRENACSAMAFLV